MPQFDVCPWWMGYLIDNHVRRLIHNPALIVGPHLRPGATCLDVGCGMGFFSLAMARMVGENGVVHAVDLQSRMLSALMRRARRRGLEERIQPRQCAKDDPGLADLRGAVDFALACWMIHEVPERHGLIGQIAQAMRPGATFLILEPKGHLPAGDFEKTLAAAAAAGLSQVGAPPARLSRTALLAKK